MRTHLRTATLVASAAALTLSLAACGTDSDPNSGDDAGSSAGDSQQITVAASPNPHAQILDFVRDNLAEDAGLSLTVQEFSDYVLPNTAVDSGEVDANFFQHQPYLDDFNANHSTDIVPVVNVHLEPLGLYSKSLDSLDGLTEGSTIAIPDDASNGGRALQLLAQNDVIELKDGVGANAVLGDITDDRGITFTELEAASLPRALDDFDAAIVNGNYALEVGLSPDEDAIALEEAEGNPYANFLAVKAGNEDDPAVQTLARLLNSDEVKQFIEDTYPGSVIPAFGTPGA
ncbi:MetQ/NlpA family ABC transporter substrate-binding protein [Streptomyces carpaticus]|uniref:Lipoprotein n=1 Tax=Streptomyces harbinensis TaxID=1176198 RepID=A0A1I6QVV8_9ACTN|nr:MULTISPECIES: MetQ/NlpA family ABC transporter substrate-binding protein [Streptomyces]UWM48093.1 MetQ/NlpA family ABC transporter substrate-binding protein [Streptomyces carpaticus]SFS56573.1 D-methionine transport system substrate-binding protein [Streptomyces harbinensis]